MRIVFALALGLYLIQRNGKPLIKVAGGAAIAWATGLLPFVCHWLYSASAIAVWLSHSNKIVDRDTFFAVQPRSGGT